MSGRTIDALMIEDEAADADLVESLLMQDPVAAKELQLEQSPAERTGSGAQEYLVKDEANGPRLRRAILASIERARLREARLGEASQSPAAATIFAFGVFELEMARAEVRRKGKVIPVHLRPLALLHYLVRNRHSVVSKDELLREVWGGVQVSDAALASALKDLRHALGDDGSHQRLVRTRRGFGYQFVAPVTERIANTSVPVRSIALLPFECLSTEREVRHLAIGITEALLAELLEIDSLRLVSRESSAKLLTSDGTLPELANELGIDFVLSGSAARSGDRSRISVRLLDAREDRHAWAGHYERISNDALLLESDLARAIARQLHVHLAGAEGLALAPAG